jgi:hypothetical protein
MLSLQKHRAAIRGDVKERENFEKQQVSVCETVRVSENIL